MRSLEMGSAYWVVMKKEDKSDKKYAIRKHAIRRAYQRYKLKLTDELYQKLCKYIKLSYGKSMDHSDGTKTEFIEKQSCSRSVWKIHYLEHSLIVIYDKTRKMINTFLAGDIDLNEIQYKKWMFEDDNGREDLC